MDSRIKPNNALHLIGSEEAVVSVYQQNRAYGSVNDAYFLHCVKSLSQPLITLDTRMKQIAAELNIEVLE